MTFLRLNSVSGRLKKILQGSAQRSLNNTQRISRLLIVDDEETVCFSMSDYFSLQGFSVDTARDVAEASRLIAAENYEVIIQDLRLDSTGDLSGMHVIRLAHEKCADTRIVVLTAYGSIEIERQSKHYGASAFLQKPKPLSQVAQVVQSLIESPPRHHRDV